MKLLGYAVLANLLILSCIFVITKLLEHSFRNLFVMGCNTPLEATVVNLHQALTYRSVILIFVIVT